MACLFVNKEKVQEAFVKAIVDNKKRITRFKLIENIAKALNLTKGQIKAIPNLELYCKFHMQEIGWSFNQSYDEFRREV